MGSLLHAPGKSERKVPLLSSIYYYYLNLKHQMTAFLLKYDTHTNLYGTQKCILGCHVLMLFDTNLGLACLSGRHHVFHLGSVIQALHCSFNYVGVSIRPRQSILLQKYYTVPPGLRVLK